MQTRHARTLARSAGLLGSLLGSLLAAPAQAQTVYRIVGPDGRVTFSDQPPSQPNAKAAPAAVAPYAPGGGGNSAAALPFELRQVAARYPVTLYTGPNCPPCQAGRALLSRRGVPFAERTVTTNEDIEALKRLGGEATLPLLTVGAQVVRGWSEPDWSQFIDAAGYPKTSQLPAGWLPGPARPLVEAQARPAPRGETAPAPAAATGPATSPASEEANPAGITF